ncbi:MAG: UDP-glucose 4-epimerase GalE [bacterium]
MKILITGGAGYIGSHAVYKACSDGHDVVIVDNFLRGFRECIETLSSTFPGKITFYNADLRKKEEIEKVFEKEKIDAVLHFAALCSVNESMEDPYFYFENNTYGTANLLDVMKKYDVRNIVFSSTCATYGPKERSDNIYDYSINELNIQLPESPYGESKLLSEKEIFWFNKLFGINYTILRYFNVCGAQENGIVGDSKRPSLLLMQNAVRGALGIEPFKLTYSEVDTPDGSPIRDYVNVEDLIDAHFLALDKMIRQKTSGIYNVGTGKGSSVLEIVNKVMEITGTKFDISKGEARKGEAKALYSNTEKIVNELGWKPARSIEDSVKSLVKWYTNRPNGWKE